MGDTHRPSPKPEDRRIAPRVEAELEVRFDTFDELAVAYTEDISDGGVFVATEEFLPVGHVVKVRVSLPGSEGALTVLARVSFVLGREEAHLKGRKPGMGMEFLDAQETQVAERVHAFLEQRIGDLTHTEDMEAPRARVLVVDDARAYREILESVLTDHGHEVVTAENGLEALTTALKDPPDLILSDVEMPTMNGWQLLRMVRSRPSLAQTPVIFLTSLRSDEDRLKGYQLGVDDYIGKPFAEDEVAARVGRLLLRSQRPTGHGATRNALRGDLSHVSLASLLSFLDVDRRTGLLLVVRENEMATLHLHEGAVKRVDLSPEQELAGVERVFHVLDWERGHFELTAAEVSPDGPIELPVQFILLEHARRADER